MAPAAPGLFSTITCCAHKSPSFAPNTRAIRSELPPGGYETISRTGLAGKFCAETAAEAKRSANASFFMAKGSFLNLFTSLAETCDSVVQQLCAGDENERVHHTVEPARVHAALQP